MSTSTAVSADRRPNVFRLPNGLRPAYVLVPGLDPEGGLVAVYADGSYCLSWMTKEASAAVRTTAAALPAPRSPLNDLGVTRLVELAEGNPANDARVQGVTSHSVEVAHRGEGAWVCRCSCGWVTFSSPTRADARYARREHLRDERASA